MKHRVWLCLLLALLLCCGAAAGSAEGETPLSFVVDGDVTVNLWEDPEQAAAYVFLPSWAEPASTVVRLGGGVQASVDGVPLEDGMTCAAFALGERYALELEGRELDLFFLRSAGTAALIVRTAAGELDRVQADKAYEAQAQLALYTADGSPDYATAGGDRITGRGNSTWRFDKKPYNLKLDKKASLLGLGKAKKWSLLANAYDESNLRNRLILDFAREMAPYEGFAPACEYVDLYVNGDYQGLYLMCMSTKDTSRAFLDTDSGDAWEIEVTMSNKLTDEDAAIPIAAGMSAEVKHPENITGAQRTQLERLIDGMGRLFGADAAEEDAVRPDTESWARKILVETVFENYDAPNASQYFWGSLKDGTVYAGPCWDYDLSMGIYYINWSTPHALMAFKDWNGGLDTSWYHGAWELPEIRGRALEIYREEVRPQLAALLDSGIPAAADRIAAACAMDRARWPGLYTRYGSFAGAVEALETFMRERIAFLDALWLEGAQFHKITMKLPNTRILHLYVRDGEPCADLPLPCEVSLPSEGMERAVEWLREGTDTPFDSSAPVTEDLVLYAVLPAD